MLRTLSLAMPNNNVLNYPNPDPMPKPDPNPDPKRKYIYFESSTLPSKLSKLSGSSSGTLSDMAYFPCYLPLKNGTILCLPCLYPVPAFHASCCHHSPILLASQYILDPDPHQTLFIKK
jgi:hypothetical protein